MLADIASITVWYSEYLLSMISQRDTEKNFLADVVVPGNVVLPCASIKCLCSVEMFELNVLGGLLGPARTEQQRQLVQPKQHFVV